MATVREHLQRLVDTDTQEDQLVELVRELQYLGLNEEEAIEAIEKVATILQVRSRPSHE